MQLTIDSSEPLDRVLQVVSSFYGVRLQPAGDGATDTAASDAAPAASQATPRRRGRKAAAAKSTSARQRPAKAAAKDDSAAVRSWARQNGHDVRDRGRIPAALIAAYKQSTRDAK